MIYSNYIRVLNIDLSTGKIRIDSREDLLPYIGGVGVAMKLLHENMNPKAHPLSEDQPIVFAIGPFNFVYPVMTKTVAAFISPLTGELGESYAGGRLGMTMFTAGFDAIVIKGKSPKPCYLSISDNNMLIKDARALWNSPSSQTGQFLRERESSGGKRSIIRIGIAGENLVKYASVCVDTYRHFGRLGLGAVFGSKNLKAITILSGERSIKIPNFPKYFKTYQEISKKCTDTEMMQKYHDLGTPINVEPLNAAGGLPTKNLSQNRFEDAADISGEVFAEKNLVRKMSCTGCPVGCIHIGQFRRLFDKGHEYESISVGYDYELIYSLGSMIGINNPNEILELIDSSEQYGSDAMSVGVALAWATEALEKSLVSEEDTIVPLKYGNKQGYDDAIKFISERANDFYKALGEGTRYASEKYGGEDFAMQVAGNEMAGYHTGYSALVGASVGARHSHLCNGGYSVDQSKGASSMPDEDIVNSLFSEEVERCMLNSLVMCLFARKIYDRPTILSAFEGINKEMSDEELSAAARRNYAVKLRIKKDLGFDLGKIKLPKRYFETESINGVLDENRTYNLINMFREKAEALLAEEGTE